MSGRMKHKASHRVGYLILRVLAIRASNRQNALARITFSLAQKVTTPPHPPPEIIPLS